MSLPPNTLSSHYIGTFGCFVCSACIASSRTCEPTILLMTMQPAPESVSIPRFYMSASTGSRIQSSGFVGERVLCVPIQSCVLIVPDVSEHLIGAWVLRELNTVGLAIVLLIAEGLEILTSLNGLGYAPSARSPELPCVLIVLVHAVHSINSDGQGSGQDGQLGVNAGWTYLPNIPLEFQVVGCEDVATFRTKPRRCMVAQIG